MIDGGRAYVQSTGLRWISHWLEDTDQLVWRLRPGWSNVGNTPTRKLNVRAVFEVRDVPYEADFLFPVDFPQGDLARVTLAPKAQIESASYDIRGADLLLVKQEKKHLYVWGAAEYNDVFPNTPRRITKFCFKAAAVTGDPTMAWDDKNNSVDIRWGHVPRQNYMDDDRD